MGLSPLARAATRSRQLHPRLLGAVSHPAALDLHWRMRQTCGDPFEVRSRPATPGEKTSLGPQYPLINPSWTSNSSATSGSARLVQSRLTGACADAAVSRLRFAAESGPSPCTDRPPGRADLRRSR